MRVNPTHGRPPLNLTETPASHPHPRRTEPLTCVILHSAGSTDAEKVDHYYRTGSSGICPHFLVLRDGTVHQYVDLDRVAYHVGLSREDRRAYSTGQSTWTCRQDEVTLPAPYTGYDEWLARWPGRKSPLDLPSGDHPNGRSVGVELLCERGLCTPEQYVALAELLGHVARETGMAVTRGNVFGHYDANPLARAGSRGGTDPGPYFEWSRAWAGLP